MKQCLRFIQSYWLWLSAIILVLISVLSLYPIASLPPVPGTDKTHHFIAYALLAFPVALMRPRRWLLLVLGYLVYSGLIEIIQPYVNRYGEWLDLAANGLGLVIGVLLASLARCLLTKL
ncbi:VanZ family protein [Motilimonas sp. KMU-193]|uniref:VanZ family protein n=1 Tax=Motilimonas sp. KMU-193 TaxID=3388668 RepID=UPI00396B1907